MRRLAQRAPLRTRRQGLKVRVLGSGIGVGVGLARRRGSASRRGQWRRRVSAAAEGRPGEQRQAAQRLVAAVPLGHRRERELAAGEACRRRNVSEPRDYGRHAGSGRTGLAVHLPRTADGTEVLLLAQRRRLESSCQCLCSHNASRPQATDHSSELGGQAAVQVEQGVGRDRRGDESHRGGSDGELHVERA